MGTFISEGASALPGVKSDARAPTGASTEWSASDANDLRSAALDLRTQALTTAADLRTEAQTRAAADAAIIASGATPADVGPAPVIATGTTTVRSVADWMQRLLALNSRALVMAGRMASGSASQFSTVGGRAAKLIGLRAALKERQIYNGYEIVTAGETYSGFFQRDYYHAVKPYPGIFDAAKVRSTIDNTQGVDPSYSNAVDDAAYSALRVTLCHRLGDSTVLSAKGDAAKSGLDSLPRTAGGLIYADPGNLPAYVWGFEDRMVLTGGVGMLSALCAKAYAELSLAWSDVGDWSRAGAAQAAMDAIVEGLTDLRRSDGFYSAASNQDVPQVMLTGLIVSHGFCTEREATESAVALAEGYSAGTISLRGAIRHLVSPNNYPSTNPYVAPGTYQNGAYWLGEWTGWVANALRVGGFESHGQRLMQDAVDEILREHRVDGTAPREYFVGPATYGSELSPAAGGFLSFVSDSDVQEVLLTLDGASTSSPMVVLPRGHYIVGAEAFCDTAETATVTVYAAARENAANDLDLAIQQPVTFGAEATVGTIVLSASTGAFMAYPVNPVGAFGGYVRAAVTGGSHTHPITIRLMTAGGGNSAPVRPSLAGSDPWSDNFSTDTLASYYLNSGGWQIASGKLSNFNGANAQVALPPVIAKDMTVTGVVQTTDIVNRFPAVCVRYVDASNYVYARLGAVDVKIYEVVDGVQVNPEIASGAHVGSAGVDYTIELSIVGTTVTVKVDGSTIATGTTTIASTPARGGVFIASLGGDTSEIAFNSIAVESNDAVAPASVQSIPPGFILEAPPVGVAKGRAWVNGEDYSGLTGAMTLRDELGAPLVSTSSPNVQVIY